jgi:glycolate oxidase iron-sulfur subunit
MLDLYNDILKNAEKCINCGFCNSVCPTIENMNYNESFGPRGRVIISKEVIKNLNNKQKILSFSDYFYSCLNCYACLYVCPAQVNAGEISLKMREFLIKNNLIKEEKKVGKMIKESIMKYQNPLGIKEKLSSWSEDIEFNKNSEILLYTGGMYQLMAYSKYLSNLERKINPKLIENLADFIAKYPGALKFTSFLYDKNLKDRMDNILKSIIKLLKYSGIEFDYLGDEEPYSGAFLFELGYIDEFIEYGKKLMELFKKRKISKIITIDPHTYEVLKSTYPKYIKDFQFDVHHYLEFININKFIKSKEKLTFHEPCHFVTHEKYDLPLKFVSKIGDVILPDRHGTNIYCCGGPDELLYPKLSESISQKRFDQLKATGAEKIVTACPICFVNLYKDETVYDLAELLINNLTP